MRDPIRLENGFGLRRLEPTTLCPQAFQCGVEHISASITLYIVELDGLSLGPGAPFRISGRPGESSCRRLREAVLRDPNRRTSHRRPTVGVGLHVYGKDRLTPGPFGHDLGDDSLDLRQTPRSGGDEHDDHRIDLITVEEDSQSGPVLIRSGRCDHVNRVAHRSLRSQKRAHLVLQLL